MVAALFRNLNQNEIQTFIHRMLGRQPIVRIDWLCIHTIFPRKICRESSGQGDQRYMAGLTRFR